MGTRPMDGIRFIDLLRNRGSASAFRWCLCAAMALATSLACAEAAQVRIVEEDGAYRLLVDGEPYYVRGGGGSGIELQHLPARGGNSFRTWTSSGDEAAMRTVLDWAHRSGLKVTMGLAVSSQRHGFDYGDRDAVRRQQARLRREVERFKDHPAVLMWAVGNELNLEYSDPRVWDAVERITRMIHRIDPAHPVMTTLAGIDRALIDQLKARAPSLDLIGIQLYGDLDRLPDKLRDSGWSGPYIVTEWGPTGHWESPLTSWNAPLEDHAERKAELLVERYRSVIAADTRQCLGSYVFLWGAKQERTPTWYGLFLPTGESTPGADAMHYLWTGQWPQNRAPAIEPIRIDDRQGMDSIVLAPDREHQALARAFDREGDTLRWHWYVLEESTATSSGGDPESVPPRVDVVMQESGDGRIAFTTPRSGGSYRLFVEVHDGHGHAAYANLPFRVAASDQGAH